MAAAESIPEELRIDIDWDDDDEDGGHEAAGDENAESWRELAAQDLESLDAPSQGGLDASGLDTAPRSGTGSGRSAGSPRGQEAKRSGADDDIEDLLVDALGEEVKPPAAKPPSGQAAKPPAKRRGRPPVYPPQLQVDKGDTIAALAEAAIGLRSRKDLELDLDCNEDLIVKFLRRRDVQRAVRQRVRELRGSGKAARRLANISLSNRVIPAMDQIVGDAELGPQPRIGAAGVIAKVAGAGGQEQKEELPRFSITLNLGGEEMKVEAPVDGERVIEHE